LFITDGVTEYSQESWSNTKSVLHVFRTSKLFIVCPIRIRLAIDLKQSQYANYDWNRQDMPTSFVPQKEMTVFKWSGMIPHVVSFSNPSWNTEVLPRYQAQTVALKNSVNNAALIGSILGQLFFGFFGEYLLGRKWNFVITTILIILGALRIRYFFGRTAW
jgi:hypothetical protein